MRIGICDDDPLFTEQLVEYTKEFFKRNHLKCPEILVFDSGEALLSDTRQKDIIFLDIEMSGLSGISTGNELKKTNKNIIIIIITAYAEYLDEAMRFQVFRYLSKPLEKHRLFRNLKDALQVYSRFTHKLPIETKKGVYTVSASDIILVEAVNKKNIIHTVSSDYESVKTIAQWSELLPSNLFFQTHRSFIVNFMHVSDFDHSLIHLYGNQFTAY
ncbi:MAG: LytTR family DNA-binding domain-containing protein, partial [Lachnospiraceae bacterium]|nr:LytTR family DNA-binding domain-containing protein [Lachnospiraceae bacterium]